MRFSLDAVLQLSGDSGVALGLVNYYYADKTGLIRAALERIGEQDLTPSR